MKDKYKNLIIRITDENNEVLETFDLAEAYQLEKDEDLHTSKKKLRKSVMNDVCDDIFSFMNKRFQPE